MTDTTAPTSTIRTIAESAVKIIADHWGKALASGLSAVVAAAITFYFTPKPVAPAPVVKTVEVIKTVPSALESRVSSLEEIAKRIEMKLDDMKPKGKRK